MGRGKAEQPKRIAEKLRQIRIGLGLSQTGMENALERQGVRIHRAYVGLFEIGERIPSILTIMAYARIAGISMETICDDEMELPEGLRCAAKDVERKG